MTTKTVYAVPGRRVRIPGSGDLIAATGTSVEWGSIWHRRLAAGDISMTQVVEDAPAEETAAPAKSGTKKTGALDEVKPA